MGLALVLMLCAGWQWHVEAAFIREAVFAEGRVLTVSRKADSAEVEFHDSSGVRRVLRPWVRSSSRTYRVGEKIAVLYDPLRPDQAAFNESLQLWGATHLCLACAAIAGVLGLLVFKRVLAVGPLSQKRIGVSCS